MFSVGRGRLIIRGNHASVSVTPEMGMNLPDKDGVGLRIPILEKHFMYCARQVVIGLYCLLWKAVAALYLTRSGNASCSITMEIFIQDGRHGR